MIDGEFTPDTVGDRGGILWKVQFGIGERHWWRCCRISGKDEQLKQVKLHQVASLQPQPKAKNLGRRAVIGGRDW